jgi:hypothetical protein
MKKEIFLSFFLMFFVISSLYLQGCASTPDSEALPDAHVYDKPYDEVWDAVEDLVFNDLRCVPKKVSKKKGIIETEWVHRIDTEGTMRWRIRSEIKKKKNGVWVLIEKQVHMQDGVRRNTQRYKTYKQDRRYEKQEAQSPHSGWKKRETAVNTIDDLYNRLREKLSY